MSPLQVSVEVSEINVLFVVVMNAAVLCFCACTELEVSRADAAIYRTNCHEKATAIILLSFIGSYVKLGPLRHERTAGFTE